jgi:hypothetical protein
MMPYQSYQQFEARRPKSAAEQRAAADRGGELAAVTSRSLRAVAARVRALAGVSRRTRSVMTGDAPREAVGTPHRDRLAV